jgi:IPT/TIG domain
MFRTFRTVGALGAAITVVATAALVGVPGAGASTPTPSISSFTPTSATVGAEVTINGSGLSGATEVAFNLIDASITSDTDSQITVTVPLGQDQGPITVTTPGGTATSPTVFTLEGFYVTPASLPNAQLGVDYQFQLETAGGTGPFHWSKSGVLPKGMKMTNKGFLSGVPILKKNATGTYPLTVRVRDSSKHGHQVATQTYDLDLT